MELSLMSMTKFLMPTPEALRIVGANHTEQVLGKSVLRFIHPDSMESIIQRMVEVTRDEHASMIVEEKTPFLDWRINLCRTQSNSNIQLTNAIRGHYSRYNRTKT